jgi:transposase
MARANEWRVRVEKWRKSGLTAEQFAERSGWSARSLRWWKWRLGLRPSGAAPAFVEVVAPLGPEPVPGGAFEVVLASGDRVVVPVAFDPDGLRTLLSALEGRRR